MSESVVITGAGLVSALGDTPSQLYAALCEGRSAYVAPTMPGAEMFTEHRVAQITGFAPKTYLGSRNFRPLDRTGQLAASAAALALADSGWTPERCKEHEIGLTLGTTFGSLHTIGEFDRRCLRDGPGYVSPIDFANTVINAAAGQVAIWHQVRGINTTVASGAAAGVQAIGYAAGLIRTGRAQALLAGGAEELCFETFFGFLQAGHLRAAEADADGLPRPFDTRRAGWTLGEGGGFLVLESESGARARGARIIGRIEGFGSAFDSRQTVDQNGPQNALGAAITAALTQAGVTPRDLHAVSSSGSGSQVLDAREAQGIADALGGARVPVTAVKSLTGEALGASGAFQAIAALEALRAGQLPPIAGLVASGTGSLDFVTGRPRATTGSRALITAVAGEGNCAALVLSAVTD